ncbi:MAG TPA: hypothetical protein VF411_15660 [Bacteroidia bacterium]
MKSKIHEYLKEKQKSIHKRIVLVVALFVVIVLSSCKKYHTCTCTNSIVVVAQTQALTAKSYTGDAKAWCTAYQSQINTNGQTGWTCTVN